MVQYLYRVILDQWSGRATDGQVSRAARRVSGVPRERQLQELCSLAEKNCSEHGQHSSHVVAAQPYSSRVVAAQPYSSHVVAAQPYSSHVVAAQNPRGYRD